MIFIQEKFLNALGLSRDEFDVLWIILLVVGVLFASIGITFARKKKNWLSDAQKRQNAKYEYTDPVSLKTEKKWTPDGWYYDEEKERWVSPDYKDGKANTSIPTYEGQRESYSRRQEAASDFPTGDLKWSPTGWYWDEKKGKWVSPDYKDAKANTNMPTYEERNNFQNQPPKRKSDDWLQNAQERQNARYEYSDPLKPKKGWVYNERARMWVDGDQFDQEQHRIAYEENRRKWEAYRQAEDAKEAERWEAIQEKKRIERHQREVIQEMNNLTPEEEELAKKIRVDRSKPTFEEWKAAREREQGNYEN